MHVLVYLCICIVEEPVFPTVGRVDTGIDVSMSSSMAFSLSFFETRSLNAPGVHHFGRAA